MLIPSNLPGTGEGVHYRTPAGVESRRRRSNLRSSNRRRNLDISTRVLFDFAESMLGSAARNYIVDGVLNLDWPRT